MNSQTLKLYPHKKFDTVHLKNDDEIFDKITHDVFDMIQKSYAPLGGNATIKRPDDIYQYDGMYVADVDEDPEPDVVVGYKNKSGTKIGYSATDGSAIAKEYYGKIRSMILRNGGWTEVSDAPAHISINKMGIRPIEDEEFVRSLLSPKQIEWHGAHPDPNVAKKFPNTFGWYTRLIDGEPHTKTIVGTPKK